MSKHSPPLASLEGSPSWPAIDPVRRLIGRLFLKFFGWGLEGGPPSIPKAVFVAAPHTSNWDLPLMLAVAWSLGLAPAWFGKHTVFRFPFGIFFRWLGGIPIDRRTQNDRVAAAVEQFAESEQLFLVISPPGTRRKTDRWKSGFYQVARLAQVHVCCSFLDFERKVGGIGPAFRVSDDVRADMDQLRAFYGPIAPKHPELKSEIRLDMEEGVELPIAASAG